MAELRQQRQRCAESATTRPTMSLGDELRLGDELYEQVERLPKGATFRLRGQLVRYHTRERARRRLRAERGRDFIACQGGYRVVAVEQATAASQSATRRR